MKTSKYVSLLLIGSILSLSLAPAAYGDDREIGGYVDRAEDRFVRNVWNFVKNFQGFQNIGSHRYQEVQYFWGEPFEFDSNHQDFVDRWTWHTWQGTATPTTCKPTKAPATELI
jgi:hypothetical protein